MRGRAGRLRCQLSQTLAAGCGAAGEALTHLLAAAAVALVVLGSADVRADDLPRSVSARGQESGRSAPAFEDATANAHPTPSASFVETEIATPSLGSSAAPRLHAHARIERDRWIRVSDAAEAAAGETDLQVAEGELLAVYCNPNSAVKQAACDAYDRAVGTAGGHR